MSTLRVPALEIVQSPGRPVYSFGVDGKMLHRIAAISRVGRNDDMSIRGYQRPEVLAHIQAIRSYLESPSPMIPNGIVVAFDERVRFESRASETAPSRAGKLVIPLDDEYRPGWIVDGQQRAAAIRDARIEAFPIMVNAFITEDVGEQRAQFILVNSTKPLPKGLIHELLPSTGAPLPLALHRRRLPALLLERLNFDPDSPLRGRIRTPTSGEGTIKDNSILKMIESSISDGALYPYRFSRKGGADTTAMLSLLKDYWTAVSQVFREAWELPPRRSRLTHGLGIVSLGYLMDAIADYFGGIAPDVVDFVEHLELVAPVCAWTGGFWQLGPYRRHWNDLQNTPRDVQVIADHLLTTYRRALRTSEAATQRASGHRLKPIASRRFSRARCRPGGLVASELQRVAEVERMRKEHEVVKKAVVLLSGGLDSATALAIAKHEGFVPHALSFRYGQRHEAELTAAARVAEAIGVEAHVTANIDLTIFGGSALTDAIDVPKQRSEAEMAKGIPITYVPARNTVFLSIALAWAEVLGAEDVFIGVNALDYSGYPDCRPEYIAAFEQMANLATKAAVEGTQQLRIHAPLIDLTKAQIIQRGLDLGVDYSLTHSCYDPDSDGLACGTCDSCVLRRKGFLEAGVPDPTLYRHRFEAVA